MVEALERCLLRFRPALKVAAGVGGSILGPLPSSSEAALVPWRQRAEAASQQKHASKVERYEQMRTLRDAGFTVPSAGGPNGSGLGLPSTACWRRTSPT